MYTEIPVFYKTAIDTPLLSIGQENELAMRIRVGDKKALDLMVRSNMRLVMTIANKYFSSKISPEEFIAAGNLGLLKAAGSFDPSVGAKFSTYAAWWIHQKMRFELANSRIVRLPRHLFERLQKIKWLIREMESTLNRPPTTQEVAHEIEVSEQSIEALLQLDLEPSHLDAPVGEIGTIADFIADPTASHDHKSDDRIMLNQVAGAFENLNKREQQIIIRRFGLNGNDPETLEQISVDWALTRERVRQLQNIALDTLRIKLKAKAEATSKIRSCRN